MRQRHRNFKRSGIQADITTPYFDAGFDFYKQTPLFTLTEKGLKDGLKNAMTKFAKVDTGCSTKVLSQPTKDELITPTGTVAGVRIGELSSGKLLFEDPKNGARTEIDILGFMGVQMKELFNRFGFYVRK